MDLLAELGANIEQLNIDGYGLLCHASFNGQESSIKWLLNKKVNINQILNTAGENALHFTISKRSDYR